VNLSVRIRKLRKAAGLRVTDLADQVGVSTAAVAQWERKKEPTTPSLDNLRKLASLFGLSLDDLTSKPTTKAS